MVQYLKKVLNKDSFKKYNSVTYRSNYDVEKSGNRKEKQDRGSVCLLYFVAVKHQSISSQLLNDLRASCIDENLTKFGINWTHF